MSLTGQFQSRVENSGLRRKVQGYALLQIYWKIPPQAGCGPAAQPPWPGILGNPFCSARYCIYWRYQTLNWLHLT